MDTTLIYECAPRMRISEGLRVIDDIARLDHFFLEKEDYCLYRGEYSPAAGVTLPTNDLILDLKKRPDRCGQRDWIYKLWAIEECARILRRCLDLDRLAAFTIVPAPPSKRPGHPEYDDRMARVVESLCAGAKLDWRELLIATTDREQRRSPRARVSPRELARLIGINRECGGSPPRRVLLVDDLITSGATFKACRLVLQKAFPGVDVVGCFVARRVRSGVRTVESTGNGGTKRRDLGMSS
jgi:hypothetical protein